MQTNRVPRQLSGRTRKILAAASLLLGATAGIASAEEVTLRNSVDVLTDKTAASDPIETVDKAGKLQVLAHDGKWARVRTAAGNEGYVSEAVLSASKGGGFDLSGLTGGSSASELSTGAAGKGFDDSVENYARNKNYSKDGLNKMIQFRRGVKGAEWKQFARDGNVGPDRH